MTYDGRSILQVCPKSLLVSLLLQHWGTFCLLLKVILLVALALVPLVLIWS